MKRVFLKRTVVSGIAISFILSWQLQVAVGQSGSRGTLQTQSSSRRPTQAQTPFEIRFWEWLSKAQYRNWGPLPGKPGDAYDGEMPHGAKVKLFANRTAVANPSELPVGSILVKENHGPDGDSLMGITVMYKSKGYNPEGGDWFWAKYEADGQVSRMNGMSVAGKVGMCIDCHSSADGGDYSFAND